MGKRWVGFSVVNSTSLPSSIKTLGMRKAAVHKVSTFSAIGYSRRVVAAGEVRGCWCSMCSAHCRHHRLCH